MNAREQSLQKRVAYLEAQNTALMMVLDRAIDDIVRAESVACAFAWDFAQSCDGLKEYSPYPDMRDSWDAAIREASK